MAAISITAANVIAGDSRQETRLASATITAGQAVRVDTNGAVLPAVNDTAANSAAYGIALNGGGAGQPIRVQTAGDITIGGTSVQGQPYLLGTAGGIIPADDIAGGEYITNVGIGKSATVVTLGFLASGVSKSGAIT